MILTFLVPNTKYLLNFALTSRILFILVFSVVPCFGAHPVPPAATGVVVDGATHTQLSPIPVTIEREPDGFRLYRNGEPYYIKGVGGRNHLKMASDAGANSIRTWHANEAGSVLDHAQDLNMTVMLGIWLSQKSSDYLDPAYRQSKRAEVINLLETYKGHPALLMWALGNEINLHGANTPEAWQFVDELARLIKSRDVDHPVISVIAFDRSALENIAAYTPNLDAIGINAYGALSDVRRVVDSSTYQGPYIITEWGVDGHWEAERTDWGRPIEPTSSVKVQRHVERYRENILNNSDRCIGSYVFLWGQKQERTPTWYSMIIENLPGGATAAACPTVDAMHFNWSGLWPDNRAPAVAAMTINDNSAAGDIRLFPGQSIQARVAATDPDNDTLRYSWELMLEPTVLGRGGSYEPRPKVVHNIREAKDSILEFNAPVQSGEYRLFVYVLDEHGHVGTANVPFVVNASQTMQAENARTKSDNS